MFANDLIATAILLIALATMAASMGMMFATIYQGMMASKDFTTPRSTPDNDWTIADKRGEFPGQRRGAGTHAVEEVVAGKTRRDEFPRDTRPGTAPGAAQELDRLIADKPSRDEFPGRRQGGGGGDNGGSTPASFTDMDTLEEDYEA